MAQQVTFSPTYSISAQLYRIDLSTQDGIPTDMCSLNLVFSPISEMFMVPLFQLSKDQNAELASQLELLKSQDEGADHSKTRGNSLFGEVDDRRMSVEKKMISLKVKHESLERTYATTKQQLRKMKVRTNF